ncbi:MAG: DUF5685 family protein [Motilibacteraceae bacterium]
MRGLLRPCRHQLDPQLRERWRAHLCGLCLTLRDTAGQAARVLTGYDVLLLSVLVEAQLGELPREQAGPCPLRGFARASVVAASSNGARLAAAGALLAGAAGLEDKVEDGDVARVARRPATRAGRRLHRVGTGLAEQVGLDPTPAGTRASSSALRQHRPWTSCSPRADARWQARSPTRRRWPGARRTRRRCAVPATPSAA